MKFRALLIALFLWSIPAFADGSFSHNFRTSGTVGSVNLLNAGISYHELSWTKTGTVSACSVEVDSSTDGITWSAGGVIGSQDCTSSGHSTVANSVVNFIRLHMVSFTGSGSVVVTWTGTVTNPAAIPDGLDSHRFLKTGTGKPINLVHTGVAYHKLTWNVQGTVSACSVELDSSSDAKTWSAGGVISGQDCTSNGASSIVNSAVNYVRLNMATFTGTGSVNVSWAGWVKNPSGDITSLSYSPSDSTIVASWTTGSAANSNITCGGVNGVDNGIAANSTSHEAIVAGLSANTPYSCTVTSGAATSSPQTVTTLTAAVRTPIASAAFGSPVVNAPTSNSGDYPMNFVSNDGLTYIGMDDGYGFAASPNAGANMQIGTITPSTMAGVNINALTSYGGFNSFSGTDCTDPAGDPMTNKQQGMFGISGNLYLMALRICNEISVLPNLAFGNAIMSPDHGATWNNYTATGTFNANGNPPAPGSFQFGSLNIGSIDPVRYAADDGTLGYLTSGNRIDGGDAYVYLPYKLTEDGTNEYLMRQPRILFEKQSTSGIQYWTGSPSVANFVNNSNWSGTFASAVPIYSVSGGNAYIGDITYIPGLNGYLLLNTFTPTLDTLFSVFNFFYGPTPAGPWTQITQQANAPTGFYSPTVVHASVIGNSSTQNVATNFLYSGTLANSYWFHNQPLTLNANALNGQQLVWYGCNPSESPISDGGVFSAFTSYGTAQATSDNRCEANSTMAGGFAVYTAPPVAGDTGAPWPATQCSEAHLVTATGNGFIGLGTRMNAAAGTGYIALWNGAGGGNIYNFTGSGMVTSIGSISTPVTAGDAIEFCAIGSTLTAYDNGSSVGSATDSTYASGNPGFEVYGSSAVTDGQIGEWDVIANQAAAPAFSTVTVGFSGNVTITGATGSSTIYYTTNGTQPTRSSSTISSGGMVAVTPGTTLRAMAAATNFADSQVTTVTY